MTYPLSRRELLQASLSALGAWSCRTPDPPAPARASVASALREIVGTGSISGPIPPRGWSRLPQYRWQAQGQLAASVVGPLLPWIVGPKRAQIAEAVALTSPGASLVV